MPTTGGNQLLLKLKVSNANNNQKRQLCELCQIVDMSLIWFERYNKLQFLVHLGKRKDPNFKSTPICNSFLEKKWITMSLWSPTWVWWIKCKLNSELTHTDQETGFQPIDQFLSVKKTWNIWRHDRMSLQYNRMAHVVCFTSILKVRPLWRIGHGTFTS